MPSWKSATVLAAGIAVAACATLARKPLPPTIELERVRVTQFLPGDARIRFALKVHNPNAYDLVVGALDATVVIEGERFATGTLVSATTLAATGDSRVEIEVRSDLAAMAAALDRISRAKRARYEVTGSALVQGGIYLRFARMGELPVGELMGTRP